MSIYVKAEEIASVCEKCEYQKGIVRYSGLTPVYTVECSKKSENPELVRIGIIRGSCPIGKWSGPLSKKTQMENGLSWEQAKAKGYSKKDWIENTRKKDEEGVSVAKKLAHAAKSIIKTQILRKDRVSDEEYTERLLICESCPGGHATFKNKKLYTCGPMLKSLTDANQKTCGCVLVKKARDSSETCPFKYWPTIKRT